MKVTRRSENGKSGHLLISVPASRVAEVEAALTFLEGKRQQRCSQEYRCVAAALWRWIGRFLQTDLSADGQQQLLLCGLAGPAACGWPIRPRPG
jgi:hypothetical protein